MRIPLRLLLVVCRESSWDGFCEILLPTVPSNSSLKNLLMFKAASKSLDWLTRSAGGRRISCVYEWFSADWLGSPAKRYAVALISLSSCTAEELI